MAETFIPPNSSNIASATYDKESRELTVEFKSGHRYSYAKVRPDTFAGLQQAPSAGGFLHRHVIGRHDERRL